MKHSAHHPIRTSRLVLALVTTPMLGGAVSCGEGQYSRRPEIIEGQAVGSAAVLPTVPPRRVPVPTGKVPMTENELREALVGRRYFNVTIRRMDHPEFEFFGPNGSYSLENERAGSATGRYSISGTWLCIEYNAGRDVTGCTQAYRVSENTIAYWDVRGRPFYFNFEAEPLPPPIIPSAPGVIVWQRPVQVRLIRTFPPVSGQVTLECASDPDGSLVDCSVIAEEPSGHGLGPAALRATTWARLSPETVAAGGRHRFTLQIEPP